MTSTLESEAPASAPRVPSLSPSRAADFMTCPLLYRFRTIDRLPEAPSVAATRGTLVHSVLEQLFDLPAVDRVPARARDLVAPAWEALVADEPELSGLVDSADALEGFLEGARELVDRYFTLEDPQRLEPHQREQLVEVPLAGGLLLRGYIDRLDRTADGALRVVDYKTGKAPTPGFEARALFQMRFYALALWRLTGVVPRMLQLVYLGSGEIIRYYPDTADLEATQRKVEALWEAIERARESRDWRASPSRLCDWCDHKALCPAWGGTPPPLPSDAPAEADAHDEEPSVRTPGYDV